jgi:multicomponent Na+:H+ antiporter subunit E
LLAAPGRREASLLRHFLLYCVLLGFWLLLSGHYNLADTHDQYLLACGALSALVATLISWRVGFLYQEGHLIRIFVRQPPYLLWLLWQIIVSNFDVARRVWSPKLNINPQMVRTPYRMKSELCTAIYANSITLTPGTVTVQIDVAKREFLVHALSDAGPAGLAAMHDRVKKLEGDD